MLRIMKKRREGKTAKICINWAGLEIDEMRRDASQRPRAKRPRVMNRGPVL